MEMKSGIIFEVSTTNFDEAVQLVEESFDIFDKEGWEKVKKLRNFKELKNFLISMDVNAETFLLTRPMK